MNPNGFRATVLEDTPLLFGGGFPAPDQKTGIALYGPYSETPRAVTIGIIGDATTVDQVTELLDIFKRGVAGDPKYPSWKPSFPGATSITGLRCDFITKPEWRFTFTEDQTEGLELVERLEDRVSQAVEVFMDYIKRAQGRENSPDIFICAPPRRMMDLCLPSLAGPGAKRGKQSRAERQAERIQDPKQRSLFDFDAESTAPVEEREQKMVSESFHSLLKARAMALKEPAPTQFLRPYTLDKIFGKERKKGSLQDLATLSWNLCVALYYKTGGRPWRLDPIPAGTCYVGIAFYRERFGDHIGTSLAQVFTPEGEGLVIRGERFKWPPRKEPHLPRDAAQRLMERVLDTYRKQTETEPSRVVVHKTTEWNQEERQGMKEGLSGIARRDFVAIKERSRFIKVFRSGLNPPLRGTMVELPDGSRLLYTRGYVPYLRIYPGARVPRPLEIVFDHVDTSRDELCREVLALTRLNWNSADYNGMSPMTLRFARDVGTILRDIPAGVTPQSKYLFYM